ncbi:hypothetical protein [Pseudomonas sp. Pse1]|uniref:hypothetical protein n=1 Tax=Pseudomonas sp. Pse1 TaxID=2926020 RepID=UPI0021194616|nr:hypothetical protein [Pseudomonas sp. Pse1]
MTHLSGRGFYMEISRCVELVRARVERRQQSQRAETRIRSFAPADASSPTKELDAVVLANTLVGYGDKITLENMAIIENLIKFAKLEANDLAPKDDPKQWYLEFLECMDHCGCFVADSGYTEYHKSSHQLTMDSIVADIVKVAVDAAQAAIPAAGVLNLVADSTLSALKKEPDSIKLFQSQVVDNKGVRLAVMPCDQLENGIIMTSLTSIDSSGGENEKDVAFFDWKTSGRTIFRATAYITFNPLNYAKVKKELEECLGEYYNDNLSKRFQRRRRNLGN